MPTECHVEFDLVVAGLLVLLVLGVTMGAETNTPKSAFIKNCKDSEGVEQEYTWAMEGAVPLQP